jgi:hypothetical protein
LVHQKREHHDRGKHHGQVLLALAVVVLKGIALIFQRIERLMFNLPPRPATTHELLDVPLTHPPVRHPAAVLDHVLADLPILNEIDPHIRSRGIERYVVHKAKPMHHTRGTVMPLILGHAPGFLSRLYLFEEIRMVALLLIRMVRQQRQRRYCLLSLVGIGVGSALWASAPLLTTRPGWLLAGSTGLLVACLVVGLVHRPPPSRDGLVRLLGLEVGMGIVLWRMIGALAERPALQSLALQSGGVHVAFFACVMGLGAWGGRRWHGAGPTVVLGRCGVAAVVGYMGLCLVSQTVAQHLLARALGPQMATVERLAALPLPGWGPVQWRGIAVTRSSYLVSRVTLVPPTVTPPDVIAKGLDTSLVHALRRYRLVRLFWHRARFPVVEVSEHAAAQTVRYIDLRATGDGRTRTRLGLVVRLNAAGDVQAMEFLNRIFLPTSPDF